ncbi:MAG: hypothetical protein A2007_06050 [Verrucomicrobia bacterium GWC2_42_7]|nr:MAG: hypothetical protein A2007_06050 [Verrucomicrobia bacterium GWC2_42_7]
MILRKNIKLTRLIAICLPLVIGASSFGAIKIFSLASQQQKEEEQKQAAQSKAIETPTPSEPAKKQDSCVNKEDLDPKLKEEINKLYSKTLSEFHALEQLKKAMDFQNKKEYGAALKIYKELIKKHPSTYLSAESYFQCGKIYIAKADYNDAFKAFDEIIKTYPDYPNFNAVIAEQFHVASLLMQGKKPRLFGIFPGIFKDYDSAINYFEGVAKNAPYSEFAPKALIFKAELAEKHGKKEDAIDALDRVVNDYAHTEDAADAYLRLADLHASLVQGAEYDQGATREAISYYEDFITLYKNDPRTSRAEAGLKKMREIYSNSRLLIGDYFYYRRNNKHAALIFYKDAISVAPEAATTDTARSRIQSIKDGIEPPKSFIDRLFGRPKDDTVKDFIDEAKLEQLANEKFSTTGEKQTTPGSFAKQTETDLKTPDSKFVEEPKAPEGKKYSSLIETPKPSRKAKKN